MLRTKTETWTRNVLSPWLLPLLASFALAWMAVPESVVAQGAAEEDSGFDEETEGEDVDDLPIYKPRAVSGKLIQTADKVLLSATYLPGNRGKKTIPIILLHDWQGKRGDLVVLALELQKAGHAVLVPDLRCHGKSTQQEIGPDKTRTLEKYGPLDKFLAQPKPPVVFFEDVVKYDLPTLKSFLMRENNAGRLNIDKLCVCGVGMGGMAAAFYAPNDWNPMLRRNKPNPRAGDVKAYIAISPMRIAGVRFPDSLANANWNMELTCLLLSGSTADKALYRPQLLSKDIEKACARQWEMVLRQDREKMRQEAGQLKDKSLREQVMDDHVFAISLDMAVQGNKLVARADSEAVLTVLDFLEILRERDILWTNRAAKRN